MQTLNFVSKSADQYGVSEGESVKGPRRLDGLLADGGEELFGRDAEPRQPLRVFPGRLRVPRPARNSAAADQGPYSIEKSYRPKYELKNE